MIILVQLSEWFIRSAAVDCCRLKTALRFGGPGCFPGCIPFTGNAECSQVHASAPDPK